MERTLKLVGKTSNEIFLLRYPASLLDFCDFDLSYFAKHSIDLCNEALKTGTLDAESVSGLRKEIRTAHCYIEHHIRTTYEKVVMDCWIDYVCRRDNIGDSALWNRFVRCKTPFEKAVFTRLCDFRYNRAINEWLNIVRVQDYAKTKVGFIFTRDVKTVEEAAARRNYFDLAFSVTARELGCRIEDLGVTKVFAVGRAPTSPFMFPNISKEIVRHVLADFDYSDDYSDFGDYSEVSDQIAMDAFSRMKAGLPQEFSSYNILNGKMEKYAEKIYMPCSLKAVIDLEIDTIIESGAWLATCKRCGRYFMKDNEHNEDYCSRFIPNGKTCLEIYMDEHPRPRMTAELEERCREVTDEIYQRVDKSMSAKEYEYWHNYLEAMKRKVDNGEITPGELEEFLNYSLEVDISRSRPIVEVAKKEPETPKERVVKPFVPERISRSAISQPAEAVPERDPEEERALREGFFTSPTKERRKNERPQISHIIRGGESLGESYTKNPDPAGFQPFGAPVQQAAPQTTAEFPEQRGEPMPSVRPAPPAPEPRPRNPYEDLKRLEEKLEEEKRLRRENAERRYTEPSGFAEDVFETGEPAFRMPGREQRSENYREQPRRAPVREEYSDDGYREQSRERAPYFEEFSGERSEEPRRTPIWEEYAESDHREPTEQREPEQPPAPRPKVIRKNAAAISAYGKIAGTPLTAAPPEMEIVSEPSAPPEPDSEPFKDIGSIFDVLEQSENDMGARRTPIEPHSKENAPSGFWTEDRHLFPEQPELSEPPQPPEPPKPEPSELDMLKEKKHGRSNKTRRLYDVIMREPDDNPNFKKKN